MAFRVCRFEDLEPGERHLTIYKPIAGWKWVMYWWNDEDEIDPDLPKGFWEPWTTADWAYGTPEKAFAYALAVAKDEFEMPVVVPKEFLDTKWAQKALKDYGQG